MRAVIGLFALAACALCTTPAHGATTSSVVDLPVPSGRMRILDVRPDAPTATVIALAGGSGFLGIQDDGRPTTTEGRCSPVVRNREAFADHGYAVLSVDDAATATAPNVQALIDYARQRAGVPVWLVGGSSSTEIVGGLAANLPASPPLGVAFFSPEPLNASVAGNIRRPALVIINSSDTTQSGAQVYAGLINAPVKQLKVLSGGSNANCGFHLFQGLDAPLVAGVAEFIDANNAGLSAAPTQTAVEYYYQAWDYYFVTSFPDEIAVLDGGAFGGVWKRTGQTFTVWSQPGAAALPTCRFFSTAFAPKSSHFYTPFAAECDSVKSNPSWQYESIAFYLQLPDAAGMCPSGTVVLHRLYNNGMGGAPNHRYTIDRATFDRMQALGWTFEGDGRTGAFACVPAPATSEAKGLWRGTTSSGRNVTVAVLEDGTYYILYSAGAPSVAGAVTGSSTASGGTFTSTRARSVAFMDYLAGGSRQITGSYVPRTSLQLTVGTGATAETINATYDTAFDTPASLASIAGSFTGRTGHELDRYVTTGTIMADGRISLVGAGSCSFKGNATPHGATGLFDWTAEALDGVCLGGPGRPVHGIMVLDPATGALNGVAPLFDSDMFFMLGTRQ